MTEKSNAEPPLVLKARDYIDKHKNEELSLADVAKAAGRERISISAKFSTKPQD